MKNSCSNKSLFIKSCLVFLVNKVSKFLYGQASFPFNNLLENYWKTSINFPFYKNLKKRSVVRKKVYSFHLLRVTVLMSSPVLERDQATILICPRPAPPTCCALAPPGPGGCCSPARQGPSSSRGPSCVTMPILSTVWTVRTTSAIMEGLGRRILTFLIRSLRM